MPNSIIPRFNFTGATPTEGTANHQNLEIIRTRLPQNALKAELFSEYERLFTEIAAAIGDIGQSSIGQRLEEMNTVVNNIVISTNTVPKMNLAMMAEGGIFGPIKGDLAGPFAQSDLLNLSQQSFRITNNSTNGTIDLSISPGAAFVGSSAIDIGIVTDISNVTPTNQINHIQCSQAETIGAGITTIRLSYAFIARQAMTYGGNPYSILIDFGGTVVSERSPGVSVDLENGILTFDATAAGYSGACTITYKVNSWRRDYLVIGPGTNGVQTSFVYREGTPAADINNALPPTIADTESAIYEILKTPRQATDQSVPVPSDEHITNYGYTEALNDHQIIRLLPAATVHDEKDRPDGNCVKWLSYEQLVFDKMSIYMKSFGIQLKGHYYHISPSILAFTAPASGYRTSFVYVKPDGSIYQTVIDNASIWPPIPAQVDKDAMLLFAVKLQPSTTAISYLDIIPLWNGGKSSGVLILDGCNMTGDFSNSTTYGIGRTLSSSYTGTIITSTAGRILLDGIEVMVPAKTFAGPLFTHGNDNRIILDSRDISYRVKATPSAHSTTINPYEICSIGRLTNSTNHDFIIRSMPNVTLKANYTPFRTHLVTVNPGTGPITMDVPHDISGPYVASANIIANSSAGLAPIVISYDPLPNRLRIGLSTRTATIGTINLLVTLMETGLGIEVGEVKLAGSTGVSLAHSQTSLDHATIIMPLYSSNYAYYNHPRITYGTGSDTLYCDDTGFGPTSDYWVRYAIVPDTLYTTCIADNATYAYPGMTWKKPLFEVITNNLAGATNYLTCSDGTISKSAASSLLYIGIHKERS